MVGLLCLVILVVSLTFVSVECKRENFPDGIVDKCHAGDSECIIKSANAVMENFKDGIPAIGIPKLEPFHINSIAISQQNNTPISLNLEMKNLDFIGFSNQKYYKIVGFERDPNKSKFELYSKIPKLTMKGQYNVSGRMLVFPIQGEGDLEVVIDDVDISTKLKLSSKIEDNEQIINVEKYKLYTTCSKMHINMSNLFNGDQVLGESTNDVMNENWKVLWDELNPVVSSALAEAISTTINRIFSKIKYDSIYLED